MAWWGYATLTTILYCLQLSLAHHVLKDFSAYFLTFLRTSPFIILIFLFGPHLMGQAKQLMASATNVKVMVAVIIIANLLTMLFMYQSVKLSTGTHAALFATFNPVVTALMIFLLFGEVTFNVYTVIAAIMMVSGSILLVFKG